MRQPAEVSHPRLPLSSAVRRLLGGAALLLAAGCAGPRPPERGHREPPQPTLAAHGLFFTDAITVDARITAFHRNAPRPDRDGEARGDRPEHGRGPGGPGMGPPPGGPPGGGFGHGEEGGRPRGAAFAALPRQTLHLLLTNRSASPLSLTITELNSALGNFVPQPDRLTLAPGASASLDPMSSDAGGLLEWLDVTVTLRSGGKTETHVLHLVPTGETVTPPPPPPAR